PAIRMAPAIGRLKPAIRRRSVVLPQPLGPSSTTVSPSATVSETRSTATRSPKRIVTSSISSLPIDVTQRAVAPPCQGNMTRAATRMPCLGMPSWTPHNRHRSDHWEPPMNINIAADKKTDTAGKPPFEVERLGARLGAEIHGLDLKQEHE